MRVLPFVGSRKKLELERRSSDHDKNLSDKFMIVSEKSCIQQGSMSGKKRRKAHTSGGEGRQNWGDPEIAPEGFRAVNS